MCTSLSAGRDGKTHIFWKAFTRLVFGTSNFATSITTKEQGNVDALGMCIFTRPADEHTTVVACSDVGFLYIFIGVGFYVARSTTRGNAKA